MLGTISVDYLSLDLEPPAVTLECLKSIPFDRFDFGVITFEHDAYRAGDTVREPSRLLLEENGYERICSNVELEGLTFEDWYCNPKHVDMNRAAIMRADDREWRDVIFDQK